MDTLAELGALFGIEFDTGAVLTTEAPTVRCRPCYGSGAGLVKGTDCEQCGGSGRVPLMAAKLIAATPM